MNRTAQDVTDHPIEPFRTFLFVPKHEAECLAEIAHVWMKGLETISMKQAEVARVAMEAGTRVAQETTRAFGELYWETSQAITRALVARAMLGSGSPGASP
jgi:hypothetical protein